MKFGPVVASLLVLSSFVAAGDKEQRAAQLLASAGPTDRDHFLPYRQRTDFVIAARGQPQVRGSLEIDFLDPTHMRRRFLAAEFDGYFIRNGTKSYTKSTSRFIPTNLSALEGMLPPKTIPLNEKVTRIFDSQQNGSALKCVEFKQSGIYCVNALGQIARREVAGDVIAFSAFEQVSDRQFPTHFEMLLGDGTHIAGTLKTVSASDLKADDFAPPATGGFQESTVTGCAGSTPPVIRFSPDPEFPREGREGTVGLDMTVGADGVPQNIQVMQSLTPANDAEAQRAVARWRFKPSMCNGSPISAHVMVQVNFRK